MKYKKGDVVEVLKQSRFIIAECRMNHYAAFNCNGNGKRLYKITDEDIIRKIGESPLHSWLLAMGMKINLRKRGEKWESSCEGLKSDGDSEVEAIGNLVILHGEKLGITIVK